MELLSSCVLAFIPMFVAVNAVGILPIFLSLTAEMGTEERKRVATQSSVIATIMAIAFVVFGKTLFSVMGFTVADFRIAGGILLLVLSVRLLLIGEARVVERGGDVGVFPLATPLITGPAVLTTALVLVGTHGWFPTLVSILLNMVFVWFVFWRSDLVIRVTTARGAEAFGKIANILLAAIAVMMIRLGLEEAFQLFVSKS
jgi:multiple antibiotic resistance protein